MTTSRTQVAVIGGGITGLSCAHRLMNLGQDVVVLEAGNRPGGKIQTVRRGGVQFEAGPNTLIANKKPMLELIAEVGLEPELVEAEPGAKRRWVSRHGRLYPLPDGPIAAMMSPLLGPWALARAAADVLGRRPASVSEDESVASFIRRRFGGAVLDNVVSPFLSGIYAGDADRLEAASVLPGLWRAETERGSVIRGLLAARKAERAAGGPTLPTRSITFRGGLEALPRRVAERLGDRVRTGARVAAVLETRGGCRVLVDGGAVDCDRVVIAAGSWAAADLLGDLPRAGPIASALRSQPAAGLAVVGLVYPREAVAHPLDGFGYLNGPGSGPVLGCLFRSGVFPHTVPPGKAMLLAFVGGANHPGYERADERQLLALVRDELRSRIGARGEPEDVYIRRWDAAIPQYNAGHARMRAQVEAWCAGRRVSIIGSALTGVSLNDCVAAGRGEAERLAGVLGGPGAGRRGVPCPSA